MKKPFCHRMARLCLLLLLLTTQHEVYCRGLVLQHSALSKAPHSSTFRFSALPSEAKLYFPLTAPILVKGKVTNENGEGIPGVSILLKGTNTGTATDGEGNYSLTLPDGSGTLIFSFIGYLSEEVLVSNRSTINISLLPDVKSLTEVVVVGYGTQEKREITGSVSTLDARQLEDQPVGQFSQRLQGRIAGVQVNQGTGKPGEGMSFRIRGAASVNAGNGPLFVVDGFPLVGDISQINPNEIESFTVLKDASASSLYGSRAANGVVLITTKIARTGQTQVQFSANYGTQIVPQQGRPDLMNGREWAQYQKELYEDKAKYEGYTGGVPQEYQNPEQYGEGTDWYGILLRNAPISSYNLSLASNKDRFSTATTMGYFKQDGVVLNTDFIRYSIRSNNEYRVNDNIRVGVNLAPTYQSGQNFETDGSITGGIFYQAVVTAPIISPYNEDGSLKINLSTPGTLTAPNWLRVLKERKNRSQVFRLLSNAYAEIDFLKSFRFKSSINVELENGKLSAFIPSTASGNIFSPPPGQASAQYSTNNSVSWMAENTLTYTKTLNNHNFEALAGYSAQKYTREFNQLTGTNFPDNAVQWIDAAAIRNGSSNNTSWSLLSLVSRLNYNYQGKYLLSLAFRRDGSSRFGANNRWGNFPSVSAGWIVSDESFAKAIPLLSYLKVRGSYGVVGNFNIGNYSQYANVGSTNYVLNNAIAQGRSRTSLGNPDLTWETTGQLDLGVDGGLFNDRLFLTFDYYKKRTNSLLYQVDIPLASGFPNIQSNVGEFSFWGYEFSASTKNYVGAFKWYTDFNLSLNRSKVLKLGTNDAPIGGYVDFGFLDYWRTAVGQPVGQFFGYVFEGLYTSQEDLDNSPKAAVSQIGTVKYKDVNGDGKIDVNDKTYIGNPNPKFLFGIVNNFSFRNFDLSIVTSGAVGGKIYNNQLEWTEALEGLFNVNRYMRDRWRTPENPGAGQIQRSLSGTTEYARAGNSRFVFNASYLTVKNITLGYTFPAQLKYLSKARIYASIQQALVLTDYPGANPEVSLRGLNGLQQGADVTSYPVPRTFAAGLNLNF